MKLSIFGLFFLLLSTTPAESRVFNIDNQFFGTYFNGNYSTSSIQQDAFVRSSGSQTEFSDSVEFNWGGELGFIFPGKLQSVRVGLQVLNPQKMSIDGKSSAGAKLMSLESSIYGVFPTVHFEFYPYKKTWGRMAFSVGAGYGKVVMKNSYDLTDAGTALYPAVSDFKEVASQYTYLAESRIGLEFFFVQNTTLTFDLGYRYCTASDLKYDSAVTNFLGGQTDGGDVLDATGDHREINLSGIFAGIGFTFYFN